MHQNQHNALFNSNNIFHCLDCYHFTQLFVWLAGSELPSGLQEVIVWHYPGSSQWRHLKNRLCYFSLHPQDVAPQFNKKSSTETHIRKSIKTDPLRFLFSLDHPIATVYLKGSAHPLFGPFTFISFPNPHDFLSFVPQTQELWKMLSLCFSTFSMNGSCQATKRMRVDFCRLLLCGKEEIQQTANLKEIVIRFNNMIASKQQQSLYVSLN